MKNLAFGYIVLIAATFAAGAQAQDEIVFAELGGVQLVSKPVDLGRRNDYMATVVELRAVDPSARLVTFANISITGEVAQLHGSVTSALRPSGNAFEEPPGPLYGAGWSALDTHLLVEEPMLGGGDWSIREENDGTYGSAGLDCWGSGLPMVDDANDESVSQKAKPSDSATPKCSLVAKAGIGPLHFTNPSDSFFLLPEFQQSSIDFAYIVTPTNTKIETEVRMTLGLLGPGIVNAGEEGGAAFGYDGNPEIVVPFTVPEPSSWLMLMMGWLGLSRLARCTQFSACP